jgi:ABC-type lipoprotein release transport system permease subunit
LKEGDKLIVHFVREGAQLQRRFVIKGIYRTGLEENDAKFALALLIWYAVY